MTQLWIASFEPFSMGEPLVSARDLPEDDQSVNTQLGPSTTTPTAATNFSFNLSECVVGTIIKIPVTQLSPLQQTQSHSETAKRTI